MQAPFPIDEASRLGTLRSLGLLDTPSEPIFDLAVDMIRKVAGVSSALVSLVDEDRQWFKARAGVDICQTPRSSAFCGYTILGDQTLWVEDARADPRFSDNPLVTGEPFIRFYAGAPLVIRGARIGSLCVLDAHPRGSDPALVALLESTAQSLSKYIDGRAQGLAARSLLANSSDAAVAVNASGRLTLWSGGAETLFGWSADEAIGRSLDLILPTDSAAAHWDGFFRYMAHGRPKIFGRPVELTARRRDGSVFPMELTLTAWDQHGLKSVGALIRDISLRKAADVQLQQALFDAQASDRAKSRFLGAMNHEMRTPLNGVLGMGYVLGMSRLDDQQRQSLDMIMESGRHLERLLADVVALTETDDPAPSSVFSPQQTLREAVRLAANKALDKGLGFQVNIDPSVPEAVIGQGGALDDIVRCLADNAVKFTAKGAVTIDLHWAAEIGLALKVADTGQGLDAGELDRLLKPFEQADNSITRRHDGAGLGLAIVARWIRRAGAKLLVHSEPGQGAAFTVELPARAVADNRKARDGRTGVPPSSRRPAPR